MTSKFQQFCNKLKKSLLANMAFDEIEISKFPTCIIKFCDNLLHFPKVLQLVTVLIAF